jgi:hypothetical protein
MRLNPRSQSWLKVVGVWLGTAVLLAAMTSEFWYNRLLLQEHGRTTHAEVIRKYGEADAEYRFRYEGILYSGTGKLVHGTDREIRAVTPGDSVVVIFLPTDPTISSVAPLHGGGYLEAGFFLVMFNVMGISMAVGVYRARWTPPRR